MSIILYNEHFASLVRERKLPNFATKINTLTAMAKPIKETPILKGKDAKRFRENLEASENNKASKSEVDQIMSGFDNLNAFAKF